MSENKNGGTSSSGRRHAAPVQGRPGGRGGAMAGIGAVKKMDKNTFKRLMRYIMAYKVHFIIVILCIVISAVIGAGSSIFFGKLIDNHIKPMAEAAVRNEDVVYTGLVRLLVFMGCLYLFSIACTYIYQRIMVVVGQGVLKTIRDSMFEHMQTLPIKYFDTNAYGDIMSRYTNDTDTLRQLITQSIPQLIASGMTIISVFVSMLLTSVWLTLVVILSMVLIMKVTVKVAGHSGSFFMKQQQALGDVNAYIEEMMNGQKVVKVFCHEEKSKKEFDELNGELFNVSSKANIYSSILGPINNNLGYLLYAVIAIGGGLMAVSEVTNLALTGVGVLTLGNIVTFLQLSRNFINPVSQLSQQLNVIVMAMAGAGRIFQLLDEESEKDNGYVMLVNAVRDEDGSLRESAERTGLWAWKHRHGNGTVDYRELMGQVTFDHVDFGYEEDRLVLHDITLYAKPGQKVALVGATGAGKTTITNLINRFYDIADGKVRYDEININKIRKPDLRHSLGVVLQEVNLFTGTVMDNIRYGKLDATDEECIAAAKLVNADSFINMLPQGYQTMLESDGANLSQGQRQLLSIARAAVADPPVMILDEATSSIDTRTEAIVQKGMDALMQGRTVFVIAHRLSTVQNSDVIMVLEQGRIIERGTHDQLIEKKGKYYQLYTGAFELE